MPSQLFSWDAVCHRRDFPRQYGEPGPAGAATPTTNWTRQHPAMSPSTRSYASMAYDQAIRKTVLFGGFDGDGDVADTWTWNGANWSVVSDHVTISSGFRVDGV